MRDHSLRDADKSLDDEARDAIEDMVQKLRLADEVLAEYAKQRGETTAQLHPSIVKAVRPAMLDMDLDAWIAKFRSEDERERPKPFRRARK